LIVLDIGLPTLNGIEAARRIRKLCPECKILFMSQESSADVAQEAFSLGAMGYVVKAHAGSELLAAVEEVCQGRQFVSRGLSGHNWTSATDAQAPGHLFHQEVLPSLVPGKAEITHSHEVQFYSDDAAFLDGHHSFIEAAAERRKSGYRGRDRVAPEESSSEIAGTWRYDGAAAINKGSISLGCCRDALDIHGE
jgi:hypothetical protein